jgi:hypothetical protein
LDQNKILSQLEELARNLGIEVRYASLRKEGAYKPGGLCRLKGEYIFIIHRKAPLREKVESLARAVNRFDLNQVYVRPGLRDFLERLKIQQEPSQNDT